MTKQPRRVLHYVVLNFLILIALQCFSQVQAAATSASDRAKTTTPKSSATPSCKNEKDCLAKAIKIQHTTLRSLTHQKQRARDQLDREYRRKIAEKIYERNQKHLKRVPEFWYNVFVAGSSSLGHSFVPLPPKNITSSSTEQEREKEQEEEEENRICRVAGFDQCVSNEIEVLKMLLRDARCYHVKPRLQHNAFRGSSMPDNLQRQVATRGLGIETEDELPVEFRHDGSADLRVEIEFEPNTLFRTRKFFRQLPSSFARELMAQDFHHPHRHRRKESGKEDGKNKKEETEKDEQEINDAKIRAYFGIGTEITYALQATKVRNLLLGISSSASKKKKKINAAENQQEEEEQGEENFHFFSLFDRTALVEAVNNEEARNRFQFALRTLFRTVCSKTERDPFTLYEEGKEILDLRRAQLLHAENNRRDQKKRKELETEERKRSEAGSGGGRLSRVGEDSSSQADL